MFGYTCSGIVIQWIRPCHKNRMTTRKITLWCIYVTSLTTSVSTMRFLIEINVHFEGDKINIGKACKNENGKASFPEKFHV